MSSVLAQLNKIDRMTKFAVFGWIRKAEKKLQIGHIPNMIRSICVLYCREEDSFGIISDHFKISPNRKCITSKLNDYWHIYINFGMNQIPSINNNMIYQWDL